METVNSAKIPINVFFHYVDRIIIPKNIPNIPNITTPKHLTIKEKKTTPVQTIRFNLNSLSKDNKEKKCDAIKGLLKTVKDDATLSSISAEILENFIIGEINIDNYLYVLESIGNFYLEKNDNNKRTLKSIFLNDCRRKIYDYIDRNNMSELALLNTDDDDDFDLFNKKKDKISNLVTTICRIFNRSNDSIVKLGENNICCLVKDILGIYETIQNEMVLVGDPLNPDTVCDDEFKYENLRKSCSVYAEILYLVFFNCIFNKNSELNTLFDTFKKKIIPTLTEAFLKSKCSTLVSLK